jgi:hypothetical protein
MRRAGQKRNVSTTTVTPPRSESTRGSGVVELGIRTAATSTIEPVATTTAVSAHDGFLASDSIEKDIRTIHREQLVRAIEKRIESRLPGRVRNLVVRTFEDTVVLEGQCATYYTKQLAQHAALGILEDEHLENSIVVHVPR